MRLLLLFVLFSPASAFSQPSTLLSGTWNTHNTAQSTVITSGLPKAKVFAIDAIPITTCPTGTPPPCAAISNATFMIYVDGSATALPYFFNEGSTAYIEAKSIVIREVNPGADPPMFRQGTWRVVQEEQLASTTYPFVDLPVNRPHLLANFITPQDFVVEVNDGGGAQCSLGFMTVFVDAKPILNPLTGKIAEFPMGSGVHGNGKNVAISFVGVCPAKKGFSGHIKFLRDKP